LERNYSSCTGRSSENLCSSSSSGGASEKKKDRVKLRKPSETIRWFPEFHGPPPWMLMYFFGPEWSSTHQCTNVDGWCTDGCTFFVPPCPWANQGGELKLTFFSFLSSAQVGILLGTSPTSLRLEHLHMHLGLLPPPPTYLPTHLPAYLCTYTLNLHQGNDEACRWKYCNIPYQVGCFILLPTYFPIKPYDFMIVENNIAMTQLRVLQLN
jgi:hypothetical protein